MDVNSFMQVRQERSMSQSYMDRRQVEMSWQDAETISVVLNGIGVFIYYADVSFAVKLQLYREFWGIRNTLITGLCISWRFARCVDM